MQSSKLITALSLIVLLASCARQTDISSLSNPGKEPDQWDPATFHTHDAIGFNTSTSPQEAIRVRRIWTKIALKNGLATALARTISKSDPEIVYMDYQKGKLREGSYLDEVNFAVLSNGTLVFDDQFTATLTDDELSWVIAHEMAHILNHDASISFISKDLRRSGGSIAHQLHLPLAFAGLLAGSLLSKGITATTEHFAGQKIGSYSAEQEYFADLQALHLMKNSGFQHTSALTSLTKAISFFKVPHESALHGRTKDRITNIQSGIRKVKP